MVDERELRRKGATAATAAATATPPTRAAASGASRVSAKLSASAVPSGASGGDANGSYDEEEVLLHFQDVREELELSGHNLTSVLNNPRETFMDSLYEAAFEAELPLPDLDVLRANVPDGLREVAPQVQQHLNSSSIIVHVCNAQDVIHESCIHDRVVAVRCVV